MQDFLHLQTIMHNFSQALTYPVIALLIILVLYMIWNLGTLIVEGTTERRHFKVALPELLAAIEAAPYSELTDVIEKSGLLGYQKRDVETLVAYGYLPEDARVALAKRLMADQEGRLTKITSRTDLVAKVAPMIGLMGTLIPLGPGVVALGNKDTSQLANSIEIAFDTTVTGLVVACLALLFGRFRKRWYEDYLVTVEAIMDAILEKAHNCLAAGEDIGNEQTAERMQREAEARHPLTRAERKRGKLQIPQGDLSHNKRAPEGSEA